MTQQTTTINYAEQNMDINGDMEAVLDQATIEAVRSYLSAWTLN